MKCVNRYILPIWSDFCSIIRHIVMQHIMNKACHLVIVWHSYRSIHIKISTCLKNGYFVHCRITFLLENELDQLGEHFLGQVRMKVIDYLKVTVSGAFFHDYLILSMHHELLSEIGHCLGNLLEFDFLRFLV